MASEASAAGGFFRALLDIVLPPHCHICHSFIPDASKLHICTDCRASLLPVSSPVCPTCGIPFAGSGDDHHCGSCLTHTVYFEYARARFLYEGAIRDLIHSFKYNRLTHLRYPLALLALEGVDGFMALDPHIIVPVPLHRSRLRQRGFNQAILLGRVLSRRLSLPMAPDALIRTRATEPQITLAAAERHRNVKGAFSVKRPDRITGKRVLLLDHIICGLIYLLNVILALIVDSNVHKTH